MVELIHVDDQGTQVVTELVDAVQGVEHRAHRLADRDVEAVRLPVEVVAHRPEEVVEIGDVVPQFVGGGHHLLGLADHVVGDSGEGLHHDVHAFHVVDGGLHLVAHLEHVLHAVLHVGHVQLLGCPGHADDERDRGVLDRGALRTGDGLHPADAGDVEDVLGHLVDDQHVRRVAQIVVGFDHQQFRVHPGLRKVPVGSLEALVGRYVGRQVVAVVVACDIRRQSQQADQSQGHRRDQNRPGPPHDGGADAPPAAGLHLALRVEQPEVAADGQDRGSHRQRGDDGDEHADRERDAEALEVRQPGEVQAERRACDGQTRAQNHVCGAVIHGVERGFAVLAVQSRLVVAPHDEDDVVGRCGDRHGGQEVHREGRQPDDVVKAQERHDAPGRGQLDEHHHQHQHDGDDGAVDQHQRHEDDDESHRGDLLHALVAGVVLVGNHCGGPGYINLQPGRRWLRGDLIAHRLDRLVGQALALVAGEVDLDVGGLAVGALRARGGQGITPEILNVLNVFGVGAQGGDEAGVVVVRLLAERCVALQHDHRRGVGVELAEVLPDPFHGLQRGRVVGGQRHRMHLADDFQLRDLDVQEHHQGEPEQQDRQREQPDESRDGGMSPDVPVGGVVLRDRDDRYDRTDGAAGRRLASHQLAH